MKNQKKPQKNYAQLTKNSVPEERCIQSSMVFSWDWPDPTDRNVGNGQTKQTEMWVLVRTNRTICGIGQTEKWVLARPKCGYWPNKTD